MESNVSSGSCHFARNLLQTLWPFSPSSNFPIPACAPGPSQWPPWTTASASWWTTCSRPCTPHLGSASPPAGRSEEHTSELQSRENLVCRLLLEKKNKKKKHKKICHCDVFI